MALSRHGGHLLSFLSYLNDLSIAMTKHHGQSKLIKESIKFGAHSSTRLESMIITVGKWKKAGVEPEQ